MKKERHYANNGRNRRWYRDYARGVANGQCSRRPELRELNPASLGAQHPYRLGFLEGQRIRGERILAEEQRKAAA